MANKKISLVEKAFRQWVESHDPKASWNWKNGLEDIEETLVSVVKQSGYIDLKSLHEIIKVLEQYTNRNT
jgi:hypothetical protein